MCVFPEASTSLGREAVELSATAGLVLDDWQAFVLERALGLRRDGKWAAFEIGLNVGRQNGKGGVFEARELTGLFLIGERLLIHSAHEFATSLEAFRRMLELIESTPDFDRRVKRVSRAHGDEGIELIGGQRIRYRTRTKGGGRGFTGDFLGLDEAMDLPEAMVGALLPTLSARPNPQVMYAGSAVDQLVHQHGVAFARVRDRALSAKPGSLAYFEYSIDLAARLEAPLRREAVPADVTVEIAADPAAWAEANPALGIRISEEHIRNELAAMGVRTFAVERLGVGDWPAVDASGDSPIKIAAWQGLVDANSTMVDPVCFAFDVTPDRAFAAVAAAGARKDGLRHVEVVEHRRGTGWVVPWLVERVDTHRPVAVLCDATGSAASLLAQLEQAGIEVWAVSVREHVAACGQLFDAVEQKTVRHLGTPELDAAVRGAVKRPLGDAWAWTRRGSVGDISPLVACTLALFGFESSEQTSSEPMVAFA